MPKALSKFRPRTSESRRIPLEREISFRVPRFENFVTEYSANISATGIFIRTHEPLAPGTEISLEFKVADDWKLIRGRGRVIWVRNKDEGPDHPAGMGIRFLEMDAQSRRLIHWMVDKQAREGGETFEFDELRQTADEALGDALGEPTGQLVGAQRGAALSPRARRATLARRAALLLVAVGLIALLAWLLVRPQPAARTAADSAPAAAPVAPAAAPPAGEEAPSATEAAARTDIAELVRGWAAAWSEGRSGDYLAAYAREFQPPNGLSRAEWEANRRERLTTPRYIRVSITALEVEVFDADRGRATFFQNYRSDRFEDTVRKSLDLVREDGRWRIVAEQVVS